MESFNCFSMTVIGIAILLMAVQNMSMLSRKWRYYYLGILAFKLIITSINVFYPEALPMPGTDSVVFMGQGTSILQNSGGNFFKILQSQHTLFSKEVAVVFYFLGVSRIYMYYVVCFCSLLAFRYMILMAKEMTDDDELAQKSGILFLTWPILLMHASSFLRENQCQFLFILSFYNFVRFVKQHNVVNFVYAVVWSILAAMTHSGMIALLICYCLLGLMASKSGEIKFSPIKIVFGFLLIFAIMSSSFSSSMTEKFKGAEDSQSMEEFSETVSRETVREANSTYIASIPSNPIKLLLLEPYLFFMFVFSPLPYQVRSFGQGVAFIIESIPQFCLVYMTFRYLVVEKNKGTSQVKSYKTVGLWTLLLFYFIFSLGTTNYGTAMRHRAKITPMLIVFSVMYYAEKRSVKAGVKKEEEEEVSFANFGVPIGVSVRSRNLAPLHRIFRRITLRKRSFKRKVNPFFDQQKRFSSNFPLETRNIFNTRSSFGLFLTSARTRERRRNNYKRKK